MSTAIAYIRKSSAPNKSTRTVSFEVQEQAVRDLAARNGDELVGVLTDWGKSGGSTRRPDYQRLLAAIDAGEIHTIYSYSLSRLSRSLLDFADLLERCRKAEVRVRLAQEGDIDWSTATGRAFAGMAALFAQFERELASERNQATVDERKSRGDHLGQAPYGYDNVKGKLVRRPDEDPDVVMAAYREAGSFAAAARLLSERNVPTRREGTRWHHTTVADVVRYHASGDLRPALVKRRGATPRGGAPLAGILRCHCGSTLTPRHRTAKSKTQGYYCARATATPGHGRMYVPEAIVMEVTKLEAARLQPGVDQVAMAEAAARELEDLDRKRSRVVDAYVEGAISKGDRDARLHDLDARRDLIAAKSSWVDVPAVDWSAPVDAVNAVLRALWERVDLGPDLRPLPDGFKWRVPEWRS